MLGVNLAIKKLTQYIRSARGGLDFAGARAAETACSPLSFIKVFDFQNFSWLNFFDNDLSNPVVFAK